MEIKVIKQGKCAKCGEKIELTWANRDWKGIALCDDCSFEEELTND